MKKLISVFLFALLLGGAMLTYSTPSFASSSSPSVEIRKPDISVEAFWDKFKWEELNPAEQQAWTILGWNKTNWNDPKAPQAPSEQTLWNKLSDKERDAAKKLGYDEKAWNANITKK